jgi:hypothetical protein
MSLDREAVRLALSLGSAAVEARRRGDVRVLDAGPELALRCRMLSRVDPVAEMARAEIARRERLEADP